MQVPVILYGEISAVRQRCTEAVGRWLTGTPFIAALEAAGVHDVVDLPTPIILDLDAGDEGWGLYLSMPTHVLLGPDGLFPPQAASPAGHDPRLDAFFEAMLTRPWAVLGLIQTPDAYRLFGPVPQPNLDRYRRFIAAVLRDFDALEALGPRYGPGVYGPLSLAQCAQTVYQGLRALSYPTDRLSDLLGAPYQSAPAPVGGLRGVLAALGVIVDPALAPQRLPDQPAVRPIPPPPPARPPADPAEVWMSSDLEEALKAHDQAAIQRLVAAGESPDRINESLQTPLTWAIRHGYVDLVDFLLDHGAALEERGPEGESPLMVAVLYDHEALVRLLLECGADVHYRTDHGYDALMFAKISKDPAIIALIEQAKQQTDRDRC